MHVEEHHMWFEKSRGSSWSCWLYFKLHSSTLASRVWGKGDCGPFESPGRLVPVKRWSVSQKKKKKEKKEEKEKEKKKEEEEEEGGGGGEGEGEEEETGLALLLLDWSNFSFTKLKTCECSIHLQVKITWNSVMDIKNQWAVLWSEYAE